MSDTYTLHGFSLSGPTYAVALMLSLCRLPFRYHSVNLRAGEQKTPEFLALNRYGQVPCLVIGDLALNQSSAILDYLAAQTGQFDGDSALDKRQAREWLFWAWDRLALGIFRSRAIARGILQVDDAVKAYFHTAGNAGLDLLDTALAGRVWLAGASPTIADIDLYTMASYATEAGFDLSARPNLGAWMARVEALPGFATADKLLVQA